MTDQVLADVSHYQGTIDWVAYGAAHPAVIISMGQGSGFTDPMFAANVAAARRVTRVRGFYLYLSKDQPVAGQAAHVVNLIRSVGGLQPGEFLIVDIEEGNASVMFAAGDQWVQQVHAALGGDEIEYSYSAFLRAAGRSSVGWIAAYQNAEPTQAHELWQFSDAYRFPGIAQPCDASIFHGSIDDLFALVTGAPPAPPAPIPTTPWEDLMAQLTDQQAAQLVQAGAASTAADSASFVTVLYKTMLPTQPIDPGGFAYWNDGLITGKLTADFAVGQFKAVAATPATVKAFGELVDAGFTAGDTLVAPAATPAAEPAPVVATPPPGTVSAIEPPPEPVVPSDPPAGT